MKLEEWRKTKGIRYSELAKLLELTIKNPIAKLRGYCVGTNIPREKEMMQKIFKLTKSKVSANDFYDLK